MCLHGNAHVFIAMITPGHGSPKRRYFYNVIYLIVNLNFNHHHYVILVGGNSCFTLQSFFFFLKHNCIFPVTFMDITVCFLAGIRPIPWNNNGFSPRLEKGVLFKGKFSMFSHEKGYKIRTKIHGKGVFC